MSTARDIVTTILADAAEGDIQALYGFINWLIYDCEIPIERIMSIGKRRFLIPYKVSEPIISKVLLESCSL